MSGVKTAPPLVIGTGNSSRTTGRRRKHLVVACSSDSSSPAGVASPHWSRWNQLTDRLVAASSIPFSILVLPQVVQNAVNMASGHASALSIISWEGYLSAMFGNTLMCSHFAASGERSAVNVQLVGILNNFLILTQVALAGFMPLAVFLAAAAFTAAATLMNLARVQRLSGPPAEAAPTGKAEEFGSWQLWQLGSGLVGLAVVPQVLYNTAAPTASTLLPFFCTLAGLSALMAIKLLSKRGSGNAAADAASLVRQLPGWGATLLFALSPLPQLVRNLLEPRSLEGLSVGTMLLALLGNALMVPRALLVRDVVWLSGTTWACTAGWGQLFSMFKSVSASTGLRYLDPWVFFSVTAALLAYAAFVMTEHRKAQQDEPPRVKTS